MATSKFTIPTQTQYPATQLLTSFQAPKVLATSFQSPKLSKATELAINPSSPEAQQRIQKIMYGDEPLSTTKSSSIGFEDTVNKPGFNPAEITKDIFQGVNRFAGSYGQLINDQFLPPEKRGEGYRVELTGNPKIDEKIHSLLFGEKPISSTATRIAEAEQKSKDLGAGKYALPLAFGAVLGSDALNFLGGKGKAGEFVTKLVIEKDVAKVTEMMVAKGFAKDIAEAHAGIIAKTSEKKVVEDALANATKLQLATKATTSAGKVIAETPKGNVPKFALGEVKPKGLPTEPQFKVTESRKVADEAINILKKDPESGLFGKGKVVRDATGKQIDGPRLFQRIGDALQRGEVDINSLPDYVKAYGLNGEETATLFKNAATYSGRTLQALSRVEKELRVLLPDMPKVKVELTGWQIFKSKWEAIDNFRRGLLVSQVATAMRNTISQGGRYSLEIVNDAFSGVINKVSGKQDAFGPMLEDVAAVFRRTNPKNIEQIEKVLKENPLESGRLFNTPVGDVALGTKVTNVLNTANRLQEFMYRNLILDAKLHTYARQGKRAITELSSDEIARAVDQALEMTFSATPKNGTFFGDLYKTYRSMPFSTVLINPFPRFMMNSMKFIMEHSPLGLMSLFSSKTRAAIAAGDPSAISKAVSGVLMLSAATVIRNNPNIGGEKWYEIRVGNKVIDTRPFAPFSTYLFIAEMWSNPERLTGADFAQGILSINRIAGTGLAVVDLFQQGTPEGTAKFFKEFTGQYLGGYTVPFRSISDVVGQFRPEEAISRDTKDNPIFGPALSNIPGINEMLPEYPSLFQKEPFKREQPLLRQATGITVKTKPYIQKEIDRLGLNTADFIPKTGDPVINRIIIKATGALLDPVNSVLENSASYQNASDDSKATIIKELVSGAKSEAKGQVAQNIAQIIYDELKKASPNKRADIATKLKNKGLMTQNIMDYLNPMLEANPF